MNERVNQINARLADIKKLIPEAKTEEEVATLRSEAASLIEERGRILEDEQRKADEEARKAFEDSQKRQPVNHTEEKEMKSFTKRQALCLLAGMCARQKNYNDLINDSAKGEENKEMFRALDQALTTTATTYVAATSEVNGVNNGGLLIPTKILLDFLREEGKLSPILNDIVFSNVKGLTVFPYRASRTAANKKAEGSGTNKNQFELAQLSLDKGWLQILIDVTDEVEALTEIDLGEYVLNRIAEDLNEDWCNQLIYGRGNTTYSEVKGVTYGATSTGISSYAAGKELEAIVAGIKLCKGAYRRGAKVYVAQDVYDAIAFATDDNGNFKFPVVNGGVGVSSLGSLKVEVDENLSDGDFVIGNVGKYFKANLLLPLSLEKDRDINKHITTYAAAQFVASAPFPGAFVKGSRAS